MTFRIVEWLKTNWKILGYPLAIVFAFLWWNKSCPKVEAPVAVTQAQGQQQENKGSVRVQVVYKDRLVQVPGEAPRPLPCPDLIIDADASQNQAHWQSQQVTQVASINPVGHQWGIFLGAGYLSAPIAQLGIYGDQWRVSAIGNLETLGALGSYDLRF